MSMLSRFAATSTTGIQYVGGKTASVTGSTATTTNISLTSLTGGLATAPFEGDLVIVYYGSGSTTDAALTVTTAGYTQVADLYANDTFDTNLTVAYKLMTATPDTSVDVSATGSTSDAGAVAIHVWRGVNSIFVFDAVAKTDTGINSVLCNPPPITPVTAGSVVVAGGAGAYASAVRTFGSSDLSNFITTGGPNSTNSVTVGIGSKAFVGGSVDPAAFTFSASDSLNNSWAAVTLALSPKQDQAGPINVDVSSAQSAGSTTTLVINKPSGVREGDLLLAFMNNATNTATWTGDTGWTEVADQGASPSTRVAYKVAGASEGASYTFTTSVSYNISGSIVAYRNAAYDAIGTIQANNTTLNCSAVSTAPYSLFVSTAADKIGGSNITAPSGVRTLVSDAGDAYLCSRLVVHDSAFSPAGNSGNRTFTMAHSTGVSAVSLAIKPAATYTKFASYIRSGSANGGSNVNLYLPAYMPGNLLLIVASPVKSSVGIASVGALSGWTTLISYGGGSSATQSGLYVFYRVADGTESSPISIDSGITNATIVSAAAIVLAGVDVTTLTASTVNTGSSTASVTANAVNARDNGIVLFCGVQSNNNQGPVSFTPPSGMTEIVERLGNTASVDQTLTVAYQEGVSAGSTGTKTATASANLGTNSFRAVLVTVGPK